MITELRSDVESKECKILSYQKTIEALTMELDGLRSRVRDLEQAKHEAHNMLVSRGDAAASSLSNGTQEPVREKLEEERKKLEDEKEKYKQLLEEESEKVHSGTPLILTLWNKDISGHPDVILLA